jgi:membrane fusion protein (multidrug efflux system)
MIRGLARERDLADSGSTGDAPQAAAPLSRARRRLLGGSNLVVVVVVAAAAVWGLWWLYDRLTHVYVLDARISADMLLLSSQVSGWVVDVPVSESECVEAGQLLVHIDDRRARAHLAELEAGVVVLDADIDALAARVQLVEHRTSSQLDAARARLQAAQSALAAAAGDLEVAEADWQRAERLRERDLVSQQRFEEIRNTYRGALQTERRRQAEVATAQADLAEAEADRAEVAVLRQELRALQARRTQAERQLEQAATELDYHIIRAPVSGTVDELFVEAGEHVAASQRVLVMHDPRELWVQANVKETDLRHFGVGDPVMLTVDAYPDEPRQGVVSRIGGAATSQFALLPNPNPSGNFTKITQRVEVSIDLDEHDSRLKPGMMVEVKIPRRS